MMRWHKASRRFVERFHQALRTRPVWFFSSGPPDGSAVAKQIPPVQAVSNVSLRSWTPRATSPSAAASLQSPEGSWLGGWPAR